jgi:hypothetical protein
MAPFVEAAVVAAPIAALSLATTKDPKLAAMAAVEGMAAHYVAIMAAGSAYGKAKDGYFSTAAGMEVEVAALTGGLFGAWLYWNKGAAVDVALKSAALAGALSWVGSTFVLPQYNKMMAKSA